MTAVPAVDVVIVSYKSRGRLRHCVEPFLGLDNVQVIVADNASGDESLGAVAGLPVTAIQLPRNGGFAYGCNAGWRAGTSPYVLFLNPDARIDAESLRTLVRVLEGDPHAGAVGPRIVGVDGSLEFSRRRFTRLRSTYAQALFLHRLFPRAHWADEVVRDEDCYAEPGTSEWISGASVLVRRSVLERLGGLDEAFFLYCEDVDLCRRIWDSGHTVRYESAAVCVHEGGASSSLEVVLPLLAASRIRYARKHRGRGVAVLERLGIGLGAITHAAFSTQGHDARHGHRRALRVVAWKTGPTAS
jgi:N-acetylglucosaminyl-diphospho-decaprenol L-rhamnosyltransferase